MAVKRRDDAVIHAMYRDLGAGPELVKIISSPIIVRGRIWGATFLTVV